MNKFGCNSERLQDSLDERLSEVDELALQEHLTHCASCQARLETLAAGNRWSQVAVALKIESGVDHPRVLGDQSLMAYNLRQPNDDEHEDFAWPATDFIVDYLKPSDMPQSLGRLGNVEIQKFIGQGAHGIVLRGLQDDLNRLVAVKVMAPHLASVTAARKRFAREARAAAAIVHANVMPILQVDSSGALPFLVMPYIDCESLQERIDRQGPLEIAEALRIALQAARGLAAAHAQGLVHRDVKPANILLERGVERVFLTDFGLARAVDDATLTRSGFIAGTPHYMSPEQARGDLIDPRSDLFSFGSVMYAMLAGRPPFRAESTFGILRRVTDDEPRSIREINCYVPDWLDAVVHRLLAKRAEDRFADAQSVADLLEGCIAHIQQPTTVPLPVEASKLVKLDQEDTNSMHVQSRTAEDIKEVLITAGVLLAVATLVVVALWWARSAELYRLRDATEAQRMSAIAREPQAQQSLGQQTNESTPSVDSLLNWSTSLGQELDSINHDLDRWSKLIESELSVSSDDETN